MAKGVLRTGGVALGVVAVAPLTWWLTLAFSDEIPSHRLQYADYMWDPPDLTGRERLVIGLVSLSAVVVGTLLVVDGIRSRRFALRSLGVVIPTAGVAGYAGLTYGLVTAPVSGANIGASLLLLAGFVVVPTLVGVALTFAARSRSEARGT